MDLSSSTVNTPHHSPRVAPRAFEVPPLDGLGLTASVWQGLTTPNTDALVIGDDDAILRVLTGLWPVLEKPRFWWDCRRPGSNLSMYDEGTLILQHLEDLVPIQQQRVLDWSRETRARSRIIATASPQLVALVESGRFSRPFYDDLKFVQFLQR